MDKNVPIPGDDPVDDEFDVDAALAEFTAGTSAAKTARPAVKDPDADLADAIRRGASDLGIDPLDYAAVMSYESGGTFDPWKGGPVTKWGKHRGTIQYGEPQRKQYGVYQGQSAAEQITKSNVKYLRDRGVRPGMKLPQIYAAINGGRTDRKLSTPDVGTGRTIADNLRLVERDHLPAVRKRFGKYFQAAGGTDDDFDVDAALDEFLNGPRKGGTGPTDPTQAMQPATTGPVTELPQTLEAQRQAAMDPASTRVGVLYTDPATAPPINLGEYDIRIANGQVLRTNAAKLTEYLESTGTRIRDLMDGTADFTPLIGGKAEPTGEQYGTTGQVAVISYDENGVELVADAITDPASIPLTAALHKKQFPGKKIRTEIVTGEDVVAGREQPPTDPFAGTQATGTADTIVEGQGQWAAPQSPATPRTAKRAVADDDVIRVEAKLNSKTGQVDMDEDQVDADGIPLGSEMRIAVDPRTLPEDGDRTRAVWEQAMQSFSRQALGRPLSKLELGVMAEWQKKNRGGFGFERGGTEARQYDGETEYFIENPSDYKRAILEMQPAVKRQREQFLGRLIGTGLPIDGNDYAELRDMGFTDAELRDAYLNDPAYETFRDLAKTNKERMQTQTAKYMADTEFNPTGSPRIAQLAALRDLGLISKDKLWEARNREIDSYVAKQNAANGPFKSGSPFGSGFLTTIPDYIKYRWPEISVAADDIGTAVGVPGLVGALWGDMPDEFKIKSFDSREVAKARRDMVDASSRALAARWGSLSAFDQYMAAQRPGPLRYLEQAGRTGLEFVGSMIKTIPTIDAAIEDINRNYTLSGWALPDDYIPSLRSAGNLLRYLGPYFGGLQALKGETYDPKKDFEGVDVPVDQRKMFALGEWVSKQLGEDPYMQNTTGGQVTSALASGLTFLVGGGLMRGVKYGAGILGAASQIGSTYEDLRKAGVADKDAAKWAVVIGTPLGFSEEWGLGRTADRALAGLGEAAGEEGSKLLAKGLLGFMKETAKQVGRETAEGILRESTEEFLQEFFQSALGQAAIAAIAAKDKRAHQRVLKFFQGLPKAMVDAVPQGLYAAVSGGILGGGSRAAVAGVNIVNQTSYKPGSKGAVSLSEILKLDREAGRYEETLKRLEAEGISTVPSGAQVRKFIGPDPTQLKQFEQLGYLPAQIAQISDADKALILQHKIDPETFIDIYNEAITEQNNEWIDRNRSTAFWKPIAKAAALEEGGPNIADISHELERKVLTDAGLIGEGDVLTPEGEKLRQAFAARAKELREAAKEAAEPATGPAAAPAKTVEDPDADIVPLTAEELQGRRPARLVEAVEPKAEPKGIQISDKDGESYTVIEDRGDKGFLVEDAKGVQKVWPLRKFDKQAVDDVRAQMPEDGLKSVPVEDKTWDYFDRAAFEKAENAALVPLDTLISVKDESSDKKFVAGLKKNPVETAKGFLESPTGKRRKPLMVAENGDGTYRVLDGNATVQALKAMGDTSPVAVQVVDAKHLSTLLAKESSRKEVKATLRMFTEQQPARLAEVAQAFGLPATATEQQVTTAAAKHALAHVVKWSHRARRHAETLKADYWSDLSEVSGAVGGWLNPIAENYLVKSAKSLTTKLKLKANKVPTDLLRSTIVADTRSPEETVQFAARVLQEMRARGYLVVLEPNGKPDVTNRFEDPTPGYKDIAFKFVRNDDGPIVYELQIMQRAMNDAKLGAGHDLYDQQKGIMQKLLDDQQYTAQELRAMGDDYRELDREQAALYGAAFAQDNPDYDQSKAAPSLASVLSTNPPSRPNIPANLSTLASSDGLYANTKSPKSAVDSDIWSAYSSPALISSTERAERYLPTSSRVNDVFTNSTSSSSIADTQGNTKPLSSSEEVGLEKVDPGSRLADPAASAVAMLEQPVTRRGANSQAVVQKLETEFERIDPTPLSEMSDAQIVAAAVAHTRAELKWWNAHKGDYKGFYTGDIAEANKRLKKWAKDVHGRTLSQAEVDLYHLVSAFGSPSADPLMDSSMGLVVFDRYLRTGELTGLTEKQATVWDTVNGRRKDTLQLRFDEAGDPSPSKITRVYQADNLATFDRLTTKFEGTRQERVEQAVKWLQEEHPTAEIEAMTGKKLAASEYVSRKDGGYGIFGITGTKLGSYFLNRTGNLSTSTKDLWYARTQARYFGLPLGSWKTNQETGKKEFAPLTSPWSDKTKDGIRYRTLSDQAWQQVADENGMELAEVQQALWDFEKRLWEHLGHPAQDRVFVSQGMEKGIEMAEALATAPPAMSATIGAAPLRAGTITKIRGAARAFGGSVYKNFVKLHEDLTKALDLTVNNVSQTVGVYGATSSNMEASVLPTVSGPAPAVRLYAALMGTLAPDIQHSVLISAYKKGGEDTEGRIVFKTREGAEDFVANRNDVGIEDLSYDPTTKTVILLDIARFGGQDFAAFLERYDDQIDWEKSGSRTAEIEFLGEDEFAGHVRTARSEGRDNSGRGPKLSTFLDEAEAKLRKAGLYEEAPLKSVAPQTLTPEFKRWFKDSKVVDGDGKPLVVYHGTGVEFDAFSKDKIGTRDNGYFGQGFYFTPDEGSAISYADTYDEGAEAEEFTPRTVAAYVSLQNPFIWDMSAGETTRKALADVGIIRSDVSGDGASFYNNKERQTFQRGIIAKGHDGVIVRDENGIREVVAFEPTQIKSAIGNNGQFDVNEDSILKRAKTAKSVQYRAELEIATTKAVLDRLRGGTLHENGELELNEADAELLRRLLAERYFQRTGKEIDHLPFDGIVLSTNNLRNLAEFGRATGREQLKAAGMTEAQLAKYDDLMNALDATADANEGHSIVYVYDTALPHERVHKEDRTAGGVSAENETKLLAMPIAQTKGTAFDRAYPHVNSTDKLSELVAIIASGEAGIFGLSTDVAAQQEFLRTWADAVIENNTQEIDAIGFPAWAQAYPLISAMATQRGEQNAENNQSTENAAAESGQTQSTGPVSGTGVSGQTEESQEAVEGPSAGTQAGDQIGDAGQGLATDAEIASATGRTINEVRTQNRKFAQTLADNLMDVGAVEYEPQTVEGWKTGAAETIEERGVDAAIEEYNRLPAGTSEGRKTALGVAIAVELYTEGRTADLIEFGRTLTENIGNAAQELRAAALMSRLSPAFAGIHGDKVVMKAKHRVMTAAEREQIDTLARQLEEAADAHALSQAALAEAQGLNEKFDERIKELEKMLAESQKSPAPNADLQAELDKALKALEDYKNQSGPAAFKAKGPKALRETRQKIETEKPEIVALLQDYFPDMPLMLPAHHGTPHVFKAEILVEYKDGKREFIEGDVDKMPEVPKGAKVIKEFPHGRMKLAKVGTGEGHAAYGHGLYFASQEKIADWYREQLSRGVNVSYRGTPVDVRADYDDLPLQAMAIRDVAAMIANSDSRNEIPVEKMINGVRYGVQRRIDYAEELLKKGPLGPKMAAQYDHDLKMLDELNQLDPKAFVFAENKGARYNVDLKPSEDEYLDLDKGYTDQSPLVQKALGEPRKFIEQMGGKIETFDFGAVPGSGKLDQRWRAEVKPFADSPYIYSGTGKTESAAIDNAMRKVNGHVIYNMLTRQAIKSLNYGKPSQEFASNWLLQKGIRGNRYLDGDSRHGGAGSHNYVIFDDRDVAIESVLKKVDPQTLTPEFKAWFKDSKVVDEEGRPRKMAHATLGDFDEFTTAPPKARHESFAIHLGTTEQAVSMAATRGGKKKLRREGANIMPLYVSLQNPLRVSDYGDGKDPLSVMGQLIEAAEISRNHAAGQHPHYPGLGAAWLGTEPTKYTREEAEDLKSRLLGNRIGWAQSKTDVAFRNQVMRQIRDWVKGFGYDGLVYTNRYEGNPFKTGVFQDSYAVFDSSQLKSAIGNNGNFDPAEDSILRSIFPNAHPDEIAAVEAAGVEVDREGNLKRWFGDSKVVDEKGNPLVVYKGMYPYDWTQEPARKGFAKRDELVHGPEIDSINSPTPLPAFNNGEEGVKIAGFFGSKETANRFAELMGSGAVFPVYLSIQNPYIDSSGRKAGDIQFGKSGVEFREAMRSGKYDGAILENTADEGTVYVALKPTQIKSAIGNNGAFDPNEGSILKSTIPDDLNVPPEAIEALVKLGAAKLIDEVPTGLTPQQFDKWLNEITGGRLGPREVAVVHALAHDMTRPAYSPQDAAAKALAKNRLAHRQRADRVMLAEGMTDVTEEGIAAYKAAHTKQGPKKSEAKWGPKAGPKKPTSFMAAVIDNGEQMGMSEETVAMALAMKVTSSERDLKKMFAAKFPDGDFAKAMNAGKQLLDLTKDRITQDKWEQKHGKDLTAKQINDVKNEIKLKATEERLKKKALERAFKALTEDTKDKFWGTVSSLYNVPRSVIFSGDLGFLLAQGLPTLLMHPTAWWKAVTTGMPAALTDKWFEQAITAAYETEMRKRLETGGVKFEQIGNVADFNDDFMSDIARHIPFVKQTNRMHSLTTDLFRLYGGAADLMELDKMYEAGKLGKTPEENALNYNRSKEFLTKKWVNVMSGKGYLGALDPLGKPLAQVGSAPRYTVSAFQLPYYTLIRPFIPGSLPKGARKIMRKNAAKMWIPIITMMAVLSKLGLVNDDPEDKDFLVIDMGKLSAHLRDLKINPLRAIKEPIRLAVGLPLKMLYYAYTGNEEGYKRIAKSYYAAFLVDSYGSIGSFWKSKLHPTLSTISQIYTGKNFVGEPLGWMDVLPLPLVFKEGYQAWTYDHKQSVLKTGADTGKFADNWQRIAATVLGSIVGFGANSYPASDTTTATKQLLSMKGPSDMGTDEDSKLKMEQAQKANQIERLIREGEDVSEIVSAALATGQITKKQADQLARTLADDLGDVQKRFGMTFTEEEKAVLVNNRKALKILDYLYTDMKVDWRKIDAALKFTKPGENKLADREALAAAEAIVLEAVLRSDRIVGSGVTTDDMVKMYQGLSPRMDQHAKDQFLEKLEKKARSANKGGNLSPEELEKVKSVIPGLSIVPRPEGTSAPVYKVMEKGSVEKALADNSVKRWSTDDWVEVLRNAKLSEADRLLAEAALKKKAENARKSKTLTPDEVKGINSVMPNFKIRPDDSRGKSTTKKDD